MSLADEFVTHPLADPHDGIPDYGCAARGTGLAGATPGAALAEGPISFSAADGRVLMFTPDPTGGYHRAPDLPADLIRAADGTFTLVHDSGEIWSFDDHGRLTSVTDPVGGVWRTEYDEHGHPVSTTDPAGAVTRRTWTLDGKLATQVDPIGRKTRYTYDPAGRLSTVTDPAGGVTSYGYDADGRRTVVISPAGLVTRTEYDQAGQVIARTDPRGWITRFEYDPGGRLSAVISPSGAITRYRHDPDGRRTEVVDANGAATRFDYTESGRIATVTDPMSRITRYRYDPDGRQAARTDPLGRTTTWTYGPAGDLTAVTDPSGRAERFEYDGDGRLIRRHADDGTEVCFGYDPAGRRTTMTDATGTTHYAYDGTGRLTTVTDPDGGVTTTEYDAAGQRIAQTYPSGLTVSYRYDPAGRLIGLRDSRAGAAAYAVDADGRLLTEQLPGRLARRYHYHAGLLSRFTVIQDGHPIAETRFTHDPDGRIRTEHRDHERHEYHYDPTGQLVGARRWVLRPWPWQHPEDRPEEGFWTEHRADELELVYDAVGNRTKLRHGEHEAYFHYDEANQLVAADSRGMRTEYRYDSSGRLVEEKLLEIRQEIRYDGFGRPAGITWHLPGRRRHTAQVFNGDDLLVAVTLTNENAQGQTAWVKAVYRWSTDPIPRVLAQRTESDPDTEPADADFSYGYARSFTSGTHGSAAFHLDAFGSNLRTEPTRDLAEAGQYGFFGVPLDHWDPREHSKPWAEGELRLPDRPRFGYRGELALGPMIQLRARSYDAGLGRFTTPDPGGAQAAPVPAASAYVFASNDPVNRTDPLSMPAPASPQPSRFSGRAD